MDLVSVIRKVHSGLLYLPEEVRRTLENRPPKSDLSARELQTLNLIVKGMSNKRIGDHFGISEATVKWHVNIILSRLSVSDRTQAAVMALNRGMVKM